MHRTTITLPTSLAELVRREAQRRRISVSALIRQLVADGLTGTHEAPRPIPWAGLVDDPGMVHGAHLDRDLEARWADDLDRDRR